MRGESFSSGAISLARVSTNRRERSVNADGRDE